MHCQEAAVVINNLGMIQVYHRFLLYFPQMGRVTQWDNQAFAFMGDLVFQMVQSVRIPGKVFNQVNAFSIPNTMAAQVTFAVDPALAALGPYANNDPNTKQYHTRCIMYLPH